MLPHQALADPTFPHGADCFPLKSIPPAVCYGSVVSSPSGSGAQPPNRFSCSLRYMYNRCNPWSVNYNSSKCVSSDWMATFWHRRDGPCLSRNPPVPSSEASHHWHVRVVRQTNVHCQLASNLSIYAFRFSILTLCLTRHIYSLLTYLLHSL